MAKKEKVAVDDVIRAIREAQGILTDAARRLGIHVMTLDDYRKRYPEVEAVITEARIGAAEKVFGRLMQKVEQGDTTAIIFAMKILGRYIGIFPTEERRIVSQFENAKPITALPPETAMRFFMDDLKGNGGKN